MASLVSLSHNNSLFKSLDPILPLISFHFISKESVDLYSDTTF